MTLPVRAWVIVEYEDGSRVAMTGPVQRFQKADVGFFDQMREVDDMLGRGTRSTMPSPPVFELHVQVDVQWHPREAPPEPPKKELESTQ